MNNFMQIAVNEGFLGLRNNDGRPFGAVIVRNNEIIAQGHNEVIKTNDPTAHAEVVAIRRASSFLKKRDLSDCEIFTTCAPCPMCLSAIYWAKIRKMYYGCTTKDAANIGFDDEILYDTIRGRTSTAKLITEQIDRDTCLSLFEAYKG